MKKDRVIFRKFPEGDVIALFPDIAADHKGNIQSYMHYGQHGAASPALIRELKKPTAKQITPLKAELRSIGYRINPSEGKMVKATVWSYDVWGNAHDGYEVNDRRKFGTFDVYKDALSEDAGVLYFLKEIEFFKPRVQLRSLEIDGDDMNIYVNEARGGYPLCGIEIGD